MVLLGEVLWMIHAESIHQFSIELCLSVTDLQHAKIIIKEINQQNRFVNNLIKIHKFGWNS